MNPEGVWGNDGVEQNRSQTSGKICTGISQSGQCVHCLHSQLRGEQYSIIANELSL